MPLMWMLAFAVSFWAPASALAIDASPITALPGGNDENAVREADQAFWAAFNRCDQKGMAERFTSDVEFYHDKTGLTQSRDAVTASMFTGPCANPAALRVRREAIVGTDRFYPLADGFAVLEGEHRFLATHSGQSERHDSKARYFELWQRDRGNSWRMRRVISFDHRSDEPTLVSTPLSTTEARRYLGSYVAADGSAMVVSDEGGLTLRSGNAVFPLVRLATGRFGTPGRWLEFQFNGDNLAVVEEGRQVAQGRRDVPDTAQTRQ